MITSKHCAGYHWYHWYNYSSWNCEWRGDSWWWVAPITMPLCAAFLAFSSSKSSEISRHSMGNSVVHERGVSNHEGHRRISDVLDNTIWRGGYQSSSGTRALVHGLYHEHLASQKERAGNYEGAAAERARAQQQHEVLERSNFGKALEMLEEVEKYSGWSIGRWRHQFWDGPALAQTCRETWAKPCQAKHRRGVQFAWTRWLYRHSQFEWLSG